MSRPSKIPDVMREKIRLAALARRQIPSDKDLAREARCSLRMVHHIIQQELLHVREMSIDPSMSED